jgi:hypothetical protein
MSSVLTTLDVLSVGPGTQAFGINDSGQVVGEYFGTNNGGIGWGGDVHGFLYNASSYTPINDPLASGGTFASSINGSDQIVGLYSGSPTGFLYSNSNPILKRLLSGPSVACRMASFTATEATPLSAIPWAPMARR